MKNLSPFCTCKKLDCPLHPTKHDKGCAPCIAKNLKTKETIKYFVLIFVQYPYRVQTQTTFYNPY